MFRINHQSPAVSLNSGFSIAYKKPAINYEPKINLPVQEEKQKKLIKYYQK
jgi:hypothetical protein